MPCLSLLGPPAVTYEAMPPIPKLLSLLTFTTFFHAFYLYRRGVGGLFLCVLLPGQAGFPAMSLYPSLCIPCAFRLFCASYYLPTPREAITTYHLYPSHACVLIVSAIFSIMEMGNILYSQAFLLGEGCLPSPISLSSNNMLLQAGSWQLGSWPCSKKAQHCSFSFFFSPTPMLTPLFLSLIHLHMVRRKRWSFYGSEKACSDKTVRGRQAGDTHGRHGWEMRCIYLSLLSPSLFSMSLSLSIPKHTCLYLSYGRSICVGERKRAGNTQPCRFQFQVVDVAPLTSPLSSNKLLLQKHASFLPACMPGRGGEGGGEEPGGRQTDSGGGGTLPMRPAPASLHVLTAYSCHLTKKHALCISSFLLLLHLHHLLL